MTDPDPVFERLRPRLFALAYRMLGTVADAEDVLQEAFLRWSATGQDEAREPGAFLTTVVARLCMDILGSARARRESYVGPSLAEPVLADDDPESSAELSDSLSLAFLVLLEELTPAERAARFLIGVTRKVPAGSSVRLARRNGQPGVLIAEDGAVSTALALDIVAGSIVGVRVVANPDKLAAVNTAAGRQARARGPVLAKGAGGSPVQTLRDPPPGRCQAGPRPVAGRWRGLARRGAGGPAGRSDRPG